MVTTQDIQYMQQAIELAQRGVGRTAPNPPVGALIVQDGIVVGRGFHPKAGEPHAEVFALREAGERAAGANVYVTLEPCSHFGRTPPCADALIKAGVSAVYVGCSDPNPQVAGRGIERLRAAGIDVQVGVLEDQCLQLIAAFNKHISSGLPYTIYKTAMTLDGNTATDKGDSRWVSGDASRARVHQLRDRVEAIMVGIGTVLGDDPLLNTRLENGIEGRDPLRVVVDSHLRMPVDCRMLHQQSQAGTLIATVSRDSERIAALERTGAEVVVFDQEQGRVPLLALWQHLGQLKIQRLLLEGGATLAAATLKAGLVDQLMLYVAPKLLGGKSTHAIFNGSTCELMTDATKLKNMHYEQIGDDLLITGEISKCSPD